MSKQHIPFRINKSKDGQFYFTIIATNGKVIATSETYRRKAGCIKGIESVHSNACASQLYNNILYKDSN